MPGKRGTQEVPQMGQLGRLPIQAAADVERLNCFLMLQRLVQQDGTVQPTAGDSQLG